MTGDTDLGSQVVDREERYRLGGKICGTGDELDVSGEEKEALKESLEGVP